MSEVYANILETLTSGLYNEIKFAVREYLQNSYDAIKAAKQESIPESDEGYSVNVTITKSNRIITITDNGIGMSEAILREYTSIGGGTKNSPEYAGHKGIGKLSGLRFFNKFIVRTKTINSDKSYELQWESGEMMKVLMSQKEKIKKIPYKDFIKDFYQIRPMEGKEKDKHYTQVQLIDVVDEFKDQVSEEEIGNFIKRNCPVQFYSDYFQYAERLTKWLDKEPSFTMTYINGKVIYQFYDDTYNLVEPRFIEIKYNDRLRAKSWFSWIKNTSEVISDEKIKGIRFRCKGICVGDNNLFANNCMPPGREQLANWFTGEVVILDDDIKPSAARDRFYEGEYSKKLYNELRNKMGRELSLIAESRSVINAAKQELNRLKIIEKEGKTIPAVFMKNISERLKELKRYQSRDKYGFNFEIIKELEAVLRKEEETDTHRSEQVAKEIEKIKKEKDTGKIIDTLLTLKTEEINAFSKDVKKKKENLIKQVKNFLIKKESEEKLESDVVNQAQLIEQCEVIVKIITKYLDIKKITYNKKELEKFVIDELKRR